MKHWLQKTAVWLMITVLFLNAEAVAETIIEKANSRAALQTIDEEAFYGTASIGKVVVPSGTTEIRSRAFAESSLTEITLPNELNVIGEEAFRGCMQLEKVRIPRRCLTVGKSAFRGCTALKEIRLLSQLTVISEAAFAQCSSLTAIQLPQSLARIEASAFSGCSALETINFPENLEFIADDALNGCPNVVATVDEGSYALEWCIKNQIEYVVEEDWGAGEFSV